VGLFFKNLSLIGRRFVQNLLLAGRILHFHSLSYSYKMWSLFGLFEAYCVFLVVGSLCGVWVIFRLKTASAKYTCTTQKNVYFLFLKSLRWDVILAKAQCARCANFTYFALFCLNMHACSSVSEQHHCDPIDHRESVWNCNKVLRKFLGIHENVCDRTTTRNIITAISCKQQHIRVKTETSKWFSLKHAGRVC